MSNSRDPSDDSERDALADLHREASKAVDERPDPRVRERVLAAAREAEAFTRARAAREKANRGRDASTQWPRSVAAVLAVAVITAFLAGRFWHDDELASPAAPARDAGAKRDTPLVASNTSATKPAQPPASAAIDGAAIAHERRPDRRSFSRDRDDPVVVTKKAEAEAPVTEATTAPAQAVARGEVASTDAVAANDTHVAAAPFPQAPAAAPLTAAPAPPLSEQAERIARRASAQGSLGGSSLSFATPAAAKTASPQAWVDAIVQLRRAGRDAEADAEVTRLRQRYPDYTVPPEALAPGVKP